MPTVPDLLCLRKDSMIQSGLDPDNPDCCFHYRMSNFQENFVMYDQLKRICLQIFFYLSVDPEIKISFLNWSVKLLQNGG